MKKVCYKCKETKDVSEFYRNGIYRQSHCKICNPLIQKEFRQSNPERVKHYKIMEQLSLEAKVDALLGSKCRNCGFADFRALAIDHINNDGKKDRGARSRLYRHVIKNPARYQRLCFNCNQIKEFERVHAVKNK